MITEQTTTCHSTYCDIESWIWNFSVVLLKFNARPWLHQNIRETSWLQQIREISWLHQKRGISWLHQIMDYELLIFWTWIPNLNHGWLGFGCNQRLPLNSMHGCYMEFVRVTMSVKLRRSRKRFKSAGVC